MIPILSKTGWCLVGNIVEAHKYGEEIEVRFGTKQFRSGAKVYLAPAI